MKIAPRKNQILGRRVDLVKSAGGIDLPSSQMKGVTVFVLIDAVGEDVTAYKVGQIVLAYRLNFIHLRGQSPRVIFPDAEIWAVIEDIPRELFSIEGDDGFAASAVGAA